MAPICCWVEEQPGTLSCSSNPDERDPRHVITKECFVRKDREGDKTRTRSLLEESYKNIQSTWINPPMTCRFHYFNCYPPSSFFLLPRRPHIPRCCTIQFYYPPITSFQILASPVRQSMQRNIIYNSIPPWQTCLWGHSLLAKVQYRLQTRQS